MLSKITLTKIFRVLPWIIILSLVDQATKEAVIRYFNYRGGKLEVTSFFNLVLTRNRGISFGIGGSWYIANMLFATLALILIPFLTYLAAKSTNTWQRMGYILIASGGLGNVIDRLKWSGVVDFLDFYIGDHHWPAFNIADCYICIGVVLLLFCSKR